MMRLGTNGIALARRSGNDPTCRRVVARSTVSPPLQPRNSYCPSKVDLARSFRRGSLSARRITDHVGRNTATAQEQEY